MNQNPDITKVLDLLKEEGESPEAIATVIQEITNAASAKLNLEMTSALTEDDLAQLDKCETQEESDILLRTLFADHSEISPEAIVNQFLVSFSQAFIDKYYSDKVAAMANPVEASAPITHV